MRLHPGRNATFLRTAARAAPFALSFLLPATEARAVPAFARQTAEPCQVCHVGGFGPQLTPYGRNFKIHGYTQRTSHNNPLAVMVIASYLNTQKSQSPPPAGFAPNNNWAVDQVSLFLAGGWGDHFGAFVQGTWDGVANQFHWDQTDLRAVDDVKVGRTDVTLGASLNNNPTVQDPWNTLPAWEFAYTTSTLAPAPASAPVINGAFAQETIGLTGYAWIDSKYYLEGGAYWSPSANVLSGLGVDPAALGAISGAAPYGRIAYQNDIGPGTLELGAFVLQAHIFPGLDHTTGFTDRYTDLGVDGSYFVARKNGDVVTLQTRYVNESQRLDATCALAGAPPATCAHNSLRDWRIDASYYWRHRYGLTVQYFNTTGSPNDVIYAANRTFKPDSAGFVVQVDTTLFPNADSFNHRANARIGLQYTGYTQFNGAGRNFDGLANNAADNNSLRVFIWVAD